jgi:cytochrome c oxidase subunit 2
MMRRAAAILCVLAAGLAGCGNDMQSSLSSVGDQAAAIGRLWNLTLAICVVVYVLVLIALAWALWRHHRAPQPGPDDRTWSKALVVFVILTGGTLTVLTAASYVTDRTLHAPEKNPLRVRITAKQWWWQVEYLADDPSKNIVTANELHLPVDRPVRIELATTDVIHSLWIPVLAGKEDLIPGRQNVLTLTPRRVGAYRGQCAEFCGLQHAHMALDVQVDDARGFAAWYAHQLQPAPTPSNAAALAGQQIFNSTACVLCHAVAGTDAGGRTGPDLTHLASRRTLAAGALPMDRTRLASWIADPQRYKPGTNMPQVPMQPQELNAVVDYLMELK